MNQVTLDGNLGGDPTPRTAKSGALWCTFSIATSRPKKDGENWVDETQWYEIKAFGAEAERAVATLKKGALVRVTGRLEQDKWTDDDGSPRKTTKIVADTVQLLPRVRPELVEVAAQA
jgi:single-strand DNA-binding protein